MTLDLLPTIARVVGAPLPPLRIDGRDAWPLIAGERGARSPQEAYFFYYETGQLQAMRSGRWKLHFPHTALVLNGKPGGRDGKPVPQERLKVGLELYDLEKDPGEKHDLAAQRPDVVTRLQSLADAERAELGDSLRAQVGSGVREPGRVKPAEGKSL